MTKKNKFLDEAEQQAEGILQDRNLAANLIDRAMEKARQNKDRIQGFFGDLKSLFKLLKCWLQGEYTDVPWRTIMSAFVGIIYFLNPFDLIPDFISFIGFMDDATVLAFIMSSMKTDIRKFQDWENVRNGTYVLH